MSLQRSDPFLRSSAFLGEDTLTKLHLTHDPDGRRLDSERLLRAIEFIMLYVSASEGPVTPAFGATAKYIDSNIELSGSQEPLGLAIYKISRKILCKCSGEGNLHVRTMSLFDMVGNYNWGAKMALVLAAFVINYGEFWLLMQLYPREPLAVSIAMLKQFPSDLSRLKPRFKALNQLVKTMVDVTECVIKFESLPLSYIELDKEVSLTKSYISVAAYWVTRSAFTCSSQITDLRAMKPDKYLDSTIIAVWEISSLLSRLSSICCRLRRQVEVCQQQIERKIWQKLLNLFKETPMNDNQEVLCTLFALTDDQPLQDCSSEAKLGVSELRGKVVMLLISKPEFLPVENFLFLVQQTYDHPLNKDYKGSYEIVWFPISSTNTWTDAEVKSFNFFSKSLPWYSIRRPWLISSAGVKYVKQEWNYTGEPLMVVFDSRGMVTNTNAIDMVMIWGVSAYPFSVSREEELWTVENWKLKLMIDEIDLLLAHWVKQGRNLCIYGSENQEWIQEVNSKMKEIESAGIQLEMVYVGKRNLDERIRNILASISEENPTGFLSLTKIQFFWLRLESMRRSRLRLIRIDDADPILEEVSALLDFSDKGWAVIAKGLSTDILKLQGDEVVQYLNLLSQRGEKIGKLEFWGVVKGAFETPLLPGPCDHSKVIPYAEGLVEETTSCEKCKRPMKKFIVFE